MNRSESIKEIATALVNFNAEVSRISKDASNPFHKNRYATLDQIIDEVRPTLNKYGLSIMQIPSGDGNTVSVKTLLMHQSGEWLESDSLTMTPVKNDPQGIGSCITYARRYGLSAFLSLNTGEDDDGNLASGKPNMPGAKEDKVKFRQDALDKSPAMKAAEEIYGNGTISGSLVVEDKANTQNTATPITPSQIKTIENMVKLIERKYPDTDSNVLLREIMTKFGKSTWNELDSDQAKEVISEVNQFLKTGQRG